MDMQTRQSYAVSSSVPQFAYRSDRRTDGATVVWADGRKMADPDSFSVTQNVDVYGASLSDNSEFPISTASNAQREAAVYGNIVVWTDYRRATKPEDYAAADIYMFNLSTGKESPVSTASGEQSGPITNGSVVVWLDRRKSRDPVTSDAADIYGYDIATGKEFAISTTAGGKSNPAISGNLVVWSEYQNGPTHGIYTYDLTTKQKSIVTTAPSAFGLAISGKIIVWEQVNLDEPLYPTEIYGYDLGTKQKFPIATGDDSRHHTASISGSQVVWVGNTTFQGGRDDIMGATISGIAIEPAGFPAPKPAPNSHLFPETGKTVSDRFLDYWRKNGGLPQQGYPISGEIKEVSDLDGKEYIVQYFERAVFEKHPENKAPYDVLLSQLGTFRLRQKYLNPSKAPGNDLTWGTITGTLNFPSEGIPPLSIYAIPVNGTGKPFAVKTWTNQLEYTMEGVVPGTYYIAAYLEGDDGLPGMAYTKGVPCIRGEPGAKCDDHTLIPVTVKAGETVRDASPVDYGPDVKLPARPAGRVDNWTCRDFKETGKVACGKFLQYWLTHGGLPQQGYPISNAFTEVSDLDGKPYTVQYFERAVFELHPENAGTQYEVLLSQLGTFRYKEKYPK
jgi:beta propeller repeat protein